MSYRQMQQDMNLKFQMNLQMKEAEREVKKAKKAAEQTKGEIQKLLKKANGGDKSAYEHALQMTRLLMTQEAAVEQTQQVLLMATTSRVQNQANKTLTDATRMAAQMTRVNAASQARFNPEKTLLTMEQHARQHDEFAMNNAIYQGAMMASTSGKADVDDARRVLERLADEANVDLASRLSDATPTQAEPAAQNKDKEPEQRTPEQEDALSQRLRALLNS